MKANNLENINNDKEFVLGDLVIKMAKAIDRRDHGTYYNLKTAFTLIAPKVAKSKSLPPMAEKVSNINDKIKNIKEVIKVMSL